MAGKRSQIENSRGELSILEKQHHTHTQNKVVKAHTENFVFVFYVRIRGSFLNTKFMVFFSGRKARAAMPVL